MTTKVKFPALQINQPIGAFYIGVISHSDLLAIAYADIRRIETELDDYMGIQRKLTKSRVKELSGYVNNMDATFPTSIILSVDQENIEWNSESHELIIAPLQGQEMDEVAKIIDGQHRIEGLKHYRSDGPFQINISIFVSADLATQANVFATVNLAQTKVNRSLVYDLYSYENTRSPQKTCHEIAVALDRYADSPFNKRIKRLGTATPNRDKEVLTQAAIVESLINYISANASEDRNTFIKRMFPRMADAQEAQKLIFRNMWLEKRDTDIAQIIINYFKAVKTKWPEAWDALDRQGNVLPKTNGFKALMRFLRPVYLQLTKNGKESVPSMGAFLTYLARIDMKDADFNTVTFPPGTSGEARLYDILIKSIGEQVG